MDIVLQASRFAWTAVFFMNRAKAGRPSSDTDAPTVAAAPADFFAGAHASDIVALTAGPG